MKKLLLGVLVTVFSIFGCDNSDKSKPNNNNTQPQPVAAEQLGYEVVNRYHHDSKAFLQGLIWHNGYFYESTGRYGESTLRKVEAETGNVLKKIDLPSDIFGEGLALAGNRLIQITWKTKKGFVYNLETFEKIQEFTYDTEGWGITYDGKDLIMSDGSDTLFFLDPQNFKVTRTLKVTMNKESVYQLNELEYIEGEIWSNVWQQDLILRINPATGHVTSFFNMRDLLPANLRTGQEDVLNGIAYDAKGKRIFVSGKLWPYVFEIKAKP